MIRVLTPDEFTDESFGWLARKMEAQQKWEAPFNPEHFFPQVHGMQNLGTLKIWAKERSALGGMFANSVYSGKPQGIVLFWWTDHEDTSGLREAFEQEAVERGCERVFSSTYREVSRDAIERLYRIKGYHASETIFEKVVGQRKEI